MTARLVHQIVGYDAATGHLVFEQDVPAASLQDVLAIVDPDLDDADAVDAYRLNARQVARIAARMILPPHAPGLAYFLECHAYQSAAIGSAR